MTSGCLCSSLTALIRLIDLRRSFLASSSCFLLNQTDPRGEGEHGAAGRGDREPGQRGSGRSAHPRHDGTRLHALLHHIIHLGLPLASQLRTLHPSAAALACPRPRETGTAGTPRTPRTALCSERTTSSAEVVEAARGTRGYGSKFHIFPKTTFCGLPPKGAGLNITVALTQLLVKTDVQLLVWSWRR